MMRSDIHQQLRVFCRSSNFFFSLSLSSLDAIKKVETNTLSHKSIKKKTEAFSLPSAIVTL